MTDTLTLNGIEYRLDRTTNAPKFTATVIKGKDERTVDIPQYVYDGEDKYEVTTIGEGAFESSKNLVLINIPTSVKVIEDRAFAYCKSLCGLNPWERINKIGNYAFEGCECLNHVHAPDFLYSIGDCAFLGCICLDDAVVNVPFNVTIGRDAFLDTGIWGEIADDTYIYTPSDYLVKYEEITKSAGDLWMEARQKEFLRHFPVTKIIIPSAYDEIEGDVFWAFSNVKEVVFESPSKIKKIPELAFAGMYALEKITLPDTIEEIGDWAFCECESLKEIVVPSSVKKIGKGAFSCTCIETLTIPESVESIGEKLFSLGRVNSVCIKAPIKELPKRIFENSGTVHIDLPDTIERLGEGSFQGCGRMKCIELPENLEILDKDVFMGSDALQEIVFKKAPVYVCKGVFDGCRDLKKITIKNTTLTKEEILALLGLDGNTNIEVVIGE